MVASLGYADGAPPINTANPAPIPLPSYERQLSCQIWSVTGNQLGVSEGAPAQALSAGQPGFSEPVDRKSVAKGKRVSGRGDLGGGRISTKKKSRTNAHE